MDVGRLKVVLGVVLKEERLYERRRPRRGTRRRRTQTHMTGLDRRVLGVDRQLMSDGATAQRRRYDAGHRRRWCVDASCPLGGGTHQARPSIYGQKTVLHVKITTQAVFRPG